MSARSFTSVAPVLALAVTLSGCTFRSSRGDDGDSRGGKGGGGAVSAPFFLPTNEPDNTRAPSIEVDAKGGIHAVYRAFAGGRAYCAYCAPGCEKTEDVAVVRFDTPSSVSNVMLALTEKGEPRVLMQTFFNLYYAAPEGDFRDQKAWRLVEIMDHRGDREVSGEAFALDPAGCPRFMMHPYVA